jgi:hypothetical protein
MTAGRALAISVGLLVGGAALVVPVWLAERRRYQGLGLFETGSGQYPGLTSVGKAMIALSPLFVLWAAALWLAG